MAQGVFVYLLMQDNRPVGIFDNLEAAMECPVCSPTQVRKAVVGPQQWVAKNGSGRSWHMTETRCVIREMELRSS